MELVSTTRKSLRSQVRELEVGASLAVAREVAVPTIIRSTATSVAADTGRSFTVNAGKEFTLVTRIS